MLDHVIDEIPPDWYADDYDALLRLVEHLHRRRTRIAELLWAAKKTTRQPFPNWIPTAASKTADAVAAACSR